MRHPGFPVATTCGRASAREASLGASTARDIAGSSSVNSPALPQHWAASGIEITRSTGIARSIRSGGSAIRWACSRWQGGSYATVTSSGAPGRVPQTGMRVQRAAAHLGRGFAYLVAVHLERADRGVVHVGEEALHYTSSEQRDGG